MKKSTYLLLALLLVFTLTACGSGKKDKDGIDINELVGTWEQQMSDGVKQYTFSSDMSYTEYISLTSPPPMQTTSTGTFSIDGNTLKISYSDFGITSEYTIKIDGNKLTLDNGSSVQEFTKK